MASNRHLGRIIALQTLYEQELRQEAGDKSLDVDAVLERNIRRYREMLSDEEFIKKLVAGVDKQTVKLDATLQPVAPEWPINQIARMDRLVLRIGLYELENEADVPPKVVINEAVELAKAFGGDNSSRFINGVLGTLLRQQEEKASKPAKSGAKKSAKPKPARKAAIKKPAETRAAAKEPPKKADNK